MSHKSQSDSALALADAGSGESIAGRSHDAAPLQFRLNAMARHRPGTVMGVLEYWLATPSGESDFDVKS